RLILILDLSGFTLYVSASPLTTSCFVHVQHGGKTAFLTSPDLPPLGESCVRLVYQMTGSDPGRLNMYVRPEGDSFDFLLWSSIDPSDSWIIASIDFRNIAAKSKLVLEGIINPDAEASIAVSVISITPGFCIVCTFEDKHFCGYNNRWNPNLNWLVGGGTVRDSPRNLPADHTLDDELGHYMYVDSVYITNLQEVAQLVSPLTTSVLSGCLSFYYQLEQKSSNSFVVYTKDRRGHYEEIWRATQAVDSWSLVEVDIEASHSFQIVFEVTFSSIDGGHVALDDIFFSSHFCSNKTALLLDPSMANCDFDDGLCNYSQNHEDNTKWTRLVRKPNPFRFGDHSSGMGKTAVASWQDYMGYLSGPILPANLQYCVRFFYALSHFGITEDALAVYIYDDQDKVLEKIWSIPKSQTRVWIQAEINYHRQEPSKIAFVSICQNFWNCGQVALDDVTVSQGDCQSPGGSWPAHPGECSFDVGSCGFIQDNKDKSNWHRRSGMTPTSFTGPKGDHTTGVGHYMYIEASHMRRGYNARLLTWQLREFTGRQCLTFFYHMYGLGTGSLNVYLIKEKTQETLMWNRKGEQSISWLKAFVDYECEKNHQIVFEAVRGRAISSDIAIDDILFKKGPCKDASKRFTEYTVNNNKITFIESLSCQEDVPKH
uniref:MAM domain containing 2a n=1 Tax=Callorhinchus milii TaxID=7868 RepID=A0A4W3I6R7_CALMI